MSETDDTDVLLLIPPDFFLVQSSCSEDSLLESSRTVVHKPKSCTAQVIGKLVDQVQSLESRLESLEITTTTTECSFVDSRRKKWESDSFDSKSFENKYYTFPRRRRRKVARKDRKKDTSLTSFDSHSTKPSIPRLKLKSFERISSKLKDTETLNDSKSMDGDLSSIVSTPNKKNDQLLLTEIDEFLTKVNAYETPNSNFKELESSVSPENVIKAAGDFISKKLESINDDIRLPSGKTMSSTVLDKYIYLVKSNQSSTRGENDLPSTSTLKGQYSDELSSNHPGISSSETPKPESSLKVTETKSPSIRKLNFTDKDVQPTSTPKKAQSSYMDSFRPSSNKIYDRASKVLEQYKSQSYNHTQGSLSESCQIAKNEFKLPQMRAFVVDNKESMKNKFIESIDTDLLSLSELWGEKVEKDGRESNKLEEERLKREHCEAMIQQLQKKLLEQQEKLAVAVKVDQAKDSAIARLKDAWLKLTGSLDKAEERHRQALNKMMREVDNIKQVATEAQKKTNHFETELYKTLDLAHDYQEKCKQLTAQNKSLQENMEKALTEKDSVIERKDKEIEVLKDNYDTVMRFNKQSTECIKNLEEALEKEKSEKEATHTRVGELVCKLQSMEDEFSLVRQECELLKTKVSEERARANHLDRQLEDKDMTISEMHNKYDNLETEVKTLRKHLELQKNELKTHYQKQLEDAVLAKLSEFQNQLDLHEKEMENEARARETQIVDTFNKQISRIEEQHKLEISVLEEKQREEIKLYRLQLAQASEKIGLLESKLEAYRRRRGELATQLHGVMEAQWRQALRILTQGNTGSSHDLTVNSVSTPQAGDYVPPSIPARARARADPDARTLHASHAPLARHSQTDTSFNFEALSDHELQQYVRLLLTAPPSISSVGGDRGGGGDKGDNRTGCSQEPEEEPTSDRPQDRDKKHKRTLNSNKPPWKA